MCGEYAVLLKGRGRFHLRSKTGRVGAPLAHSVSRVAALREASGNYIPDASARADCALHSYRRALALLVALDGTGSAPPTWLSPRLFSLPVSIALLTRGHWAFCAAQLFGILWPGGRDSSCACRHGLTSVAATAGVSDELLPSACLPLRYTYVWRTSVHRSPRRTGTGCCVRRLHAHSVAGSGLCALWRQRCCQCDAHTGVRRSCACTGTG